MLSKLWMASDANRSTRMWFIELNVIEVTHSVMRQFRQFWTDARETAPDPPRESGFRNGLECGEPVPSTGI
jgi:hypothetical protein